MSQKYCPRYQKYGEAGCRDMEHDHKHHNMYTSGLIRARNIHEIITFNLGSLLSAVRKEILYRITDGLRLDDQVEQQIVGWVDRTIESNVPTIPEVRTIYNARSTLHTELERHFDNWARTFSSVIYSNPVQQELLHDAIHKLLVRFVGHFLGPIHK